MFLKNRNIIFKMKKSKVTDYAALSQPMGVNKLNELSKTMALKAYLPDLRYMRIANTSVRKHLCQKRLNSNIPDTHAIHITGHKYLQSLNTYLKSLNKQKQHVSTHLSSSSGQNENQEFSMPQFLPNIQMMYLEIRDCISVRNIHVLEAQRLVQKIQFLYQMYMYLKLRDSFKKSNFCTICTCT